MIILPLFLFIIVIVESTLLPSSIKPPSIGMNKGPFLRIPSRPRIGGHVVKSALGDDARPNEQDLTVNTFLQRVKLDPEKRVFYKSRPSRELSEFIYELKDQVFKDVYEFNVEKYDVLLRIYEENINRNTVYTILQDYYLDHNEILGVFCTAVNRILATSQMTEIYESLLRRTFEILQIYYTHSYNPKIKLFKMLIYRYEIQNGNYDAAIKLVKSIVELSRDPMATLYLMDDFFKSLLLIFEEYEREEENEKTIGLLDALMANKIFLEFDSYEHRYQKLWWKVFYDTKGIPATKIQVRPESESPKSIVEYYNKNAKKIYESMQREERESWLKNFFGSR